MGAADTTPRSYLIDGSPGRWGGAATPGDDNRPSAAGDSLGLRLTADPNGSLRLDSRDGSLGRLVLPRWVAVDARLRVYLLDRDSWVVRTFDPLAPPDRPFRELPYVGGKEAEPSGPCAVPGPPRPPEARRFRSPLGIAADRDNLYVADSGNGRVQVFALDSLALRAIWPFAGEPIDVAVFRGTVYVLTATAIWRHRRGDDRPESFIAPQGAGPWQRLAVDRGGRLYALRVPQGEPAGLDVFLPSGQPETDADNQPRRVFDPAEVRDRFDFPAVRSVPEEDPTAPLQFILPEELNRPCGRQRPAPPAGRSAEVLLGQCPPWSDHPCGEACGCGCCGTGTKKCCGGGGLVFGTDGACVPVRECRLPQTPLFRPTGGWIGPMLDSGTYHGQWDRVQMTLADLPPGCVVRVSTYTDDEPHLDAEIHALPDAAWSDPVALAGDVRDPKELARDPRVCTDFPIMNGPGRYLWLRVELLGDGFGTPLVQSLRAYFPRQSYLQYLPAFFSEEEQSRRFLERFLAIFQREWDSLEARVAGIAKYFDPAAVPAEGGFLEYLAGWLGVTFENGWTPEQRRRLLRAVPALTFAARGGGDDDPGRNRRGTLAGMRDYVNVYLQNLAGTDLAKDSGFPVVVEGFRERDVLLLAQPTGGGTASPAGPPAYALWGSEVVGRSRTDDNARLDETRLLSEGDPDLDVFAAHAHRFRVVVPAAWVPDAAAEAALCRAIEAEKPAHTDYALHLVGARFRVGVQSTVGLDTILGGVPRCRLPAADDASAAPHAPPSACLGYDTVLAAADESDAVRLGPGLRLGVEAARL